MYDHGTSTLKKCEIDRHKCFDRSLILLCRNDLRGKDILRNALYYHFYIRIMSKYLFAHMRGQGTSAALRRVCTHST